MMNDIAIRSCYPNVVTVRYQEDESVIATDANEKVIKVDQKLVDAWVDPNAYQELRTREYPPIGDQLDALYHAGVFPTEMAATIKAIKAKYPKGNK